MTKDVLAVSASSVDVERLFNLARDVITYRRDRLNSNTIETIMMIKYNLNNDRVLNESEFFSLDDDEFFANENSSNFLFDLSLSLSDEKNNENDNIDDYENSEKENNLDDDQHSVANNDDIIMTDSSSDDDVREFKRTCRRDVNSLNQSLDMSFSFSFLTDFSHRINFVENSQVVSSSNIVASLTSQTNMQSQMKLDSSTLSHERELRSNNTQSRVKIEFFFTSHNLNK